MSQYTGISNRAQNLIARKGATVTFTRAGAAGVYDPTTGVFTGGTSVTVTASAVQVRSNPQMLIALELVLTMPVTLLVAVAGFSAPFVPQPVDTFVWGGFGYTVKFVQDTAPDSVAILYKIIGYR